MLVHNTASPKHILHPHQQSATAASRSPAQPLPTSAWPGTAKGGQNITCHSSQPHMEGLKAKLSKQRLYSEQVLC